MYGMHANKSFRINLYIYTTKQQPVVDGGFGVFALLSALFRLRSLSFLTRSPPTLIRLHARFQ